MGRLSGILKGDNSDFPISLHSIKAKYELISICKSGLSSLILKKIPEIGEFLQQIDEISSDLFEDIFSLNLGSQPKIEKKTGSMNINSNDKSKSLETAQQIGKESQNYKQEKEALIKRFQEDRQEMLDEIESLKEENKKYLDTIVRHSKSYAESNETGKKNYADIRSKSIDEDKIYSMSISANKMTGKILSFRQLKEVIDEIYASKAKYDERCADGKMPRETMEQHMYTYLNTKYGLKNLILEWASSIIASVKKHSSRDNDIAVFGKTLRNECDEEFRFVQIQVKETVAELLKMHLKSRYPLKNNADINEMINEKTNGYLYEEE